MPETHIQSLWNTSQIQRTSADCPNRPRDSDNEAFRTCNTAPIHCGWGQTGSVQTSHEPGMVGECTATQRQTWIHTGNTGPSNCALYIPGRDDTTGSRPRPSSAPRPAQAPTPGPHSRPCEHSLLHVSACSRRRWCWCSCPCHHLVCVVYRMGSLMGSRMGTE